ncbi:cation:proton antiporter [Holzapfeliella floricola]|nr:cation:proton antiporter [Holzapfeliella floricola]
MMIMHLILSLFLILIVSTLLKAGFQKVNLPLVIGELLTGILLGPALLGWIHTDESISTVSEVGVVLLLFIAGSHSDLKTLKSVFKSSLTVAVLGVIAPIILIATASITIFAVGFNENIFLGIVLAATSISIALEVLKESGLLQSKMGNVLIGAAIVDDFLTLFILSLFINFNSTGSFDPLALGQTLILQVIFFGFVFVFKKCFPFFDKFLQTKSISLPYFYELFSLVMIFGLSILAEKVGLSGIMGAFFAGIILKDATFFNQVSEKISATAYLIFIPLFFASIGLNMTLDGALDNLPLILIFTLIAILSKFLPGKLVSQYFGLPKNQANIVGSGMIARGEVALILVQTGLTKSIISHDLYVQLIIVVILTTVLTPFMLNYYIKKAG